MTTLRVVLSLGLGIFMVALIFYGPQLIRALREWRGLWGLVLAWVALALSHARLIGGGATSAGGSLGIGELIELGFFGLGTLLTAVLILKAPATGPSSRLPLLALAAYAVLGMSTAFIGEKPMLSLFKASQILVFASLALVSVNYLRRAGQPRFLIELIYTILMIILCSAAIGGVLAVDGAYKSLFLGGGGLFGVTLYAVIPHVHPNGLGLFAAIMVLVGLRRTIEPVDTRRRFFYFSLTALAFSVMFAAQSRTSIVALALGLIVLSISVRRLRGLVLGLAVGALVLVFVYTVTVGQTSIKDNLFAYLKRGQSEQEIQNMSGRTGLWSIGSAMIADRPLFGHGFQTGARYGAKQYGLAEGSNMHSAHMQVLVDSGILGYLVWLVFSAAIAWRCGKALFRARPGREEASRFVAETGAIVLMVFLRSGVGHVLVTLDFNTMLYAAIFIFMCAGTERRGEPEKCIQSPKILRRIKNNE